MYMEEKKISKPEKIVLAFLAPVAVLGLWQLGCDRGVINSSILPSPYKIFQTLISLIGSGRLWRELSTSIVRVLKGFALGAGFGVIVGILMGLFARINGLLNSLFSLLRPIPLIAWVPILIMWTGIGEASKVYVIAIGAFWPALLNTIHGIQSVDRKLLEVAALLEKSRFVILTKIVLPSAVPSIITGLKLGVSSSWSCVVAAEMLAASRGIGYMISYARQMGQPYVMMAGIFVIAIIGFLIDFCLKKIQKRLLRWDVSGER